MVRVIDVPYCFMKRFILYLLSTFLIMLSFSERVFAMEKNYNYITSANGYSAVVFDEKTKRVNMFFPHIYKNYDKGREVKNIAYDTYFGLLIDNEGFWLPERVQVFDSLSYLERTGIIHSVRTFEKVRVEEYIFSPMSVEGSSMIMLIEVNALSDIQDLSVFSIHNFHLGLENDKVTSNQERIVFDESDIYIETSQSSDYIVAYKPLISQTIHSTNPVNPYNILKIGERLTNVQDSGIVDDAVCGFEKDFGSLRQGESRWFGVLILYQDEKDIGKIVDSATRITEGKSIEDFLKSEIDFYREFLKHIDKKVLQIFDSDPLLYNAAVFLKMAQVRESNSVDRRPNGQILASLPPGMWNITWLRDMMYSVYALIEIGLKDEALDAIKFILNADTGYFKDYVGTDYKFSVCRYYGDGMEESDFNEDGPNIEFDGAGLFLIGVARYIAEYGVADISEYSEEIFSGFADVLLSLIDSEGLIKADSSIWERHLNGKERHYAYTQITALGGLCGAMLLSKRLGDYDRLAKYREGYERLKENILNKLIHKDGYFVSSLEEYRAYAGYLDASVVEAINFGVIDPDDVVAKKTLDMMNLLKTTGGGYKRNDDGDWYDKQEWIFIDLRIADAYKRIDKIDIADSIINRVKSYVLLNNYQFPELISEDGNSVTGSIPMIGFGAASYILSRIDSNFDTCDSEPVDASYDITDMYADGDEGVTDILLDIGPEEDIRPVDTSSISTDENLSVESNGSGASCSCNYVE